MNDAIISKRKQNRLHFCSSNLLMFNWLGTAAQWIILYTWYNKIFFFFIIISMIGHSYFALNNIY